jgi:uroporphyrinogen decarboxylase
MPEETLLPKDRVRLAVEHKSTDRVPIDFAARSEVVAALRARLGAGSDEHLLQILGVDIRGVGPDYIGPRGHALCYADPTAAVTPDGLYRDIWGVGFRANQTATGFYMDLADSPLAAAGSEADLDRHPWPTPALWNYTVIPDQIEVAKNYWLWAHSRGIFEISWFLRGFENFLLDLAAEPEFACAVMDRVQAYLFERTKRILEAGRGGIDMMEYNDDVGSQKGLLISPALWRKFLKPRMADFIGLCRKHHARVRYHSCGSIRPILPDLIEIGVDILNPVQTAAADMDLEGLNRDFGDKITFNGGIDTEHLLPHASRNEVYGEVSRILTLMTEAGGYILASSHVFQPDVPIDNVLAVFEAAGSVSTHP